ncbi:MAG TPA: universal stress protein [Acidimicrobiales bacterium]
MTKIVVGVDGSPDSERALDWAIEEARLRGAEVVLVHSWIYPYVGPRTGIHEPYDDMKLEAARTLDEIVGAAAERAGDVKLHPVLVEGSPAGELVREGADALMIVLGSRGRGGFKSLLLGSTSHQVVHHATCPVVVLRKPA